MANEANTSGLARLPFPGDIIDGRYRLGAVVASGGMGVVMKADQLRTGRQVAMKLLHPHVANQPDFATRFRREAEVATLFDHNSIVRVYDVGETESGVLFLVMELLKGEELDDVIKRESPLKLGRVMNMSLQMLDGLAEAHSEGVVHRDIKPANVFVCQNRRGEDDVKLLDFGVAKLVNSSATQITKTGSITGTPSYIAPESMFQDEENNWKAADVYAAGLVILEMMTGQRNFEAEAMAQTMLQHLKEPVVIPAAIADTELAQVLVRATAKHPDDRFQDADEMYLALRNCQGCVDGDLVVFDFDGKPRHEASSSQISHSGLYNAEGADLSVLRQLPQHVVEGSGEPIGDLPGEQGTLAAYPLDNLDDDKATSQDITPAPAEDLEEEPTQLMRAPQDVRTSSPSRESTDLLEQEAERSLWKHPAVYGMAAVAVVLLGGIGAWWVVGDSSETTDSAELAQGAERDASESAESVREAADVDEAADQEGDSEEARDSDGEPSFVLVDSEPTGAEVWSGDEQVGETAMEFDRATWEELSPIRLSLSDHEDVELAEFPDEEWHVIAMEEVDDGDDEMTGAGEGRAGGGQVSDTEPEPEPEPSSPPPDPAPAPAEQDTPPPEQEESDAEEQDDDPPDIDGMIDEHLF